MAEITNTTNIGIDVSKDWLNIVVTPSGDTLRTENTKKIVSWSKKLEAFNSERMAIEAIDG